MGRGFNDFVYIFVNFIVAIKLCLDDSWLREKIAESY